MGIVLDSLPSCKEVSPPSLGRFAGNPRGGPLSVSCRYKGGWTRIGLSTNPVFLSTSFGI